MAGAVRLSMVALVLVNLAFVSITEAARWTWLGPLLAATLLSPVLVRFTGNKLYRAFWNVSLLGVFALLLQHTFDAGVAHLLEDGLLLAALCQVHLLNNLRDDQQPDLLFFNSFLIAVVTSFLTIDVQYFALFLVYAPVLVVGMQLLALAKSGVTMPVRRVVLSGAWRSGVVLGLTMAVFAVWPRDFARKGLLGEQLERARSAVGKVDFSDQVLLDRSGTVTASDRVVMRVRGPRRGMPLYWRGATMEDFEGYGWKPSHGFWYRGAPFWRLQPSGWWLLPQPDREPTYEVHSTLARTQKLFLPVGAARFRIEPPAHDVRIAGCPDGTVWHRPYRQPIRYQVRLRRGTSGRGGAIPKRVAGKMLRCLQVRPSVVPAEARRLAAEIRGRVGRDAPQHEFVEAVRAELSRRYRYLAPGSDGGARTLEQFFSGTPGHCEYFATAICVMLRSEGVLCRMVTGYRSDDWESGELRVRELHAHAWAEVLDPMGGWYTVDASPAPSAVAAAAGTGFLARVRRWAEGLWAKITGFDEQTRSHLLAWLTTLPRRTLWPAVGLLLALAIVVVMRRRREPPAIRAYRRALRKHRVVVEPGETPRDVVERVPELADATIAHERARYGYGCQVNLPR